MKKNNKQRLFCNKKRTLLLALCLSLSSGCALAAEEADFRTEEYYAGNGLELINAASAYAKGYSGKGITMNF